MKYFKTSVLGCLISMQICYGAWAFYLKYLAHMFSVNVCMADVLVNVSGSLYMGIFIAPCIIFITYRITDDSNRLNYVIRHKSRRNVYLKNCIESMISCVFFTVYHLVSVYVWSVILKLDNYTWKATDSYYFKISHKPVETNYTDFLVKYTLTFLLTIWIISLGSVLCKWAGNRILAFLFFISLGVMEFSVKEIKILEKILINYGNVDLSIYDNVMFGIALLIILVVAGTIISGRKEYYSDFGS